MNAIAWIMVGFVLTVVVVALIVEHETKKRSLDRYTPRPDDRDSRLYWTRTWRN
jgi:hypothetical protein